MNAILRLMRIKGREMPKGMPMKIIPVCAPVWVPAIDIPIVAAGAAVGTR